MTEYILQITDKGGINSAFIIKTKYYLYSVICTL